MCREGKEILFADNLQFVKSCCLSRENTLCDENEEFCVCVCVCVCICVWVFSVRIQNEKLVGERASLDLRLQDGKKIKGKKV